MNRDGFEDRFYARQRAEIMARLDAAGGQPRVARRRRAARLVLPLAATLLLAALLAGGVALRGENAPAEPASADWLFAWDLPEELSGADPLAAFDPDALEQMATTDDSDTLDGLLPPLVMDEEDNS